MLVESFVKFKVRITRDLTSCLQSDKDLNVSVVNYYLQHLRDYTQDNAGVTWVAPCSFLKALRNNNEDRYFKRTFEGLKRIVIPGVLDNWWYLIFVDLEKKHIITTRFGTEQFTKHVLTEKTNVVTWLNKHNLKNDVKWKTFRWNRYPRTHEDSGIFACMLAEKLLLPEAVEEKDPSNFRKKMYSEIWKQK